MICLQQPQQSWTLVHILADLLVDRLVDRLVDYLVDNQRANAKRFPSLLMNTKEIQPESKPESTKLTRVNQSQPRDNQIINEKVNQSRISNGAKVFPG